MRVRAVMIRILRQLKHDKRTIGLMVFAPILVLTLMSFIFGGETYNPKIGIVNAPLQFVNSLEESDAAVTRYTEAGAARALYEGEADAVVDFKNGVPNVELEGSDPAKSRAVLSLVKSSSMKADFQVPMEVSYLFGYDDMSGFDNFGPILIGFFVFFFVFLVSGIAFLGERNSGTLERLMATPVRRWEIVAGYILGFGVFTILQSALIAWFSIEVLHIMMVGSFALVLLITILTAMTALTIGIFVSAFANNEMQMIQFVPIIIVPQVFFSGLFDLSTMAGWLQAIGRFTPLWYVADALRSIMIKGKGWDAISFDVLVLCSICLFFIAANILILKKYRRI